MQVIRTVLVALALVSVAVAGQTSEKSKEVSSQNTADRVQHPAIGNRKSAIGDGSDAITIPQMMSYQGRLTDASGVPVPDGNYRVEFRLYTEPEGGSPFWSESQSVTTHDGLFSVLLGSVTPISDVPDAGEAYIGLAVEGSAEMVPRLRIAGTYASPREKDGTSFVPPGGTDDDDEWVRSGSDSVLYTIHRLGIARGGIDNRLYGSYACSHTNLGNACTTGVSGANMANLMIGGGYGNRAWAPYTAVCGGRNNKAGNRATDTSAIVAGGYDNKANAKFAAVVGGDSNIAGGANAFVGGGYRNRTDARFAVVVGGDSNLASGVRAFVGGGYGNTARGADAFVGGGYGGTARGDYCAVVGGEWNTASGSAATVGGGILNDASNLGAAVGGGWYNTASGEFSTIGGGYSCNAGHNYSAAFTQSHTIAANQVRAAAFSTGYDAFSVDHPAVPLSKILNQYAVGSPELVLLYRGAATIGPDGRAEVWLPGYFDQMNRNPMVQLTGVGTFEVYVAQDISGNRFTIGGPAGAKVYWTVTGERKDLAADMARIFTPVEQGKTGNLAGHSLDDDALSGYMDGLEKLGLDGKYSFRTTEGRQQYEKTKKPTSEERGRQK